MAIVLVAALFYAALSWASNPDREQLYQTCVREVCGKHTDPEAIRLCLKGCSYQRPDAGRR